MKIKKWFNKWYLTPAILLTVVFILIVGGSMANLVDTESSTGTSSTGWTSAIWQQTSQSDFNAGYLTNVDTTTSPGDVVLPYTTTTYPASGNTPGGWTNPANAYSSNDLYATLAPTTSTRNPTVNTGSAWTNPANAYADDANYAYITSGTPSASYIWGNYGFSLAGETVQQVRVRYDAWSAGYPTSDSQTRVPTSDMTISGTWLQLTSRIPNGDGDISGAWGTLPLWDEVGKNLYNDATYMTGTTDAGGYKLFTFPAFDIPSGATITSVTVVIRARDSASGTNNIYCRIKVGGNYYNGTSRNPGTTFTTYNDAWTTNPKAGGAWTVAQVNGTDGTNDLQQIGVYSTDLAPDMWVSLVYVQVAYTTSPTSYYSVVDETSPDDNDFIYSTSSGYRLSGFPAFSVPVGATITNLRIYYRGADSILATGANNIRACIKAGGTVYNTTDAGNNPVETAFNTYSYTFATNPKTASAWTVADINGTGANPLQEIGVATNDASPNFRITMYYAECNYSYTEYDDEIRVDVSSDGGTNWSSTQNTVLTGTQATYWYDVTELADWDDTTLNDSNFKVRALAYTQSSYAEEVRLDWLPVEVISANLSHIYTTYNISAAGYLISTLEVGIEAYAASSEKVELEVTWNGGTNWSTIQTSNALGVADPNTVTWFDFTSAPGADWDATKLNNTNFMIRMTYLTNGAWGMVSLDYLPVRIAARMATGMIASDVWDTTVAGSSWDGLFWDNTLPSGTSLTFETRASDTSFAENAPTPSWNSLGSVSPSSATITNNPTANTGTAWTNPGNAYANDTSYANITSGNPSGSNVWGNYGFSLAGSTISQVRVRYDAWSEGDAMSVIQRPTGNDANTANFTFSNVSLYNDAGDASDATYIRGAIDAGGYCTFTYPAFSIPSGSTNINLNVVFRFRSNTSVITNNGDARIKVGGTYYASSTSQPNGSTGSILEITKTWATNPKSGTGWTTAEINGTDATNPLQAFGVGGTDFNPDVLFYDVWAYVTYTPSVVHCDDEIRVDVSWDGGTSWSSTQNTVLTSAEATTWYDVTSATAWDSTKLNDTNLKVRALAYTQSGNVEVVRLDWLAVEVAYTSSNTLGSIMITNGAGRYKQWRATLTTTAAADTPTLSEVKLYYDGG